MPRGIPAPVLTELNKTQISGIFYLVRVKLQSGYRYWAERGGIVFDGHTYDARLLSLGSLGFSIDDASQVQIILANADDAITLIDQTESFLGAKIEIIEYIDSIAAGYVKWVGWSDELTELSGEQVTLTAYAGSPTSRSDIPKRAITVQCNNEFGKSDSGQTVTDFDGFECPYQRTSTIGFKTTTATAIDGTSDPVTFDINALPSSQLVVTGDELIIGSERLLIIAASSNTLTGVRAQRGTTIASHSIGATALFGNCGFSINQCKARGMYGNNSSDMVGGNNRNYFTGFPQITGHQPMQLGNSHIFLTANRVSYPGNDSAYGRRIPLVYGKARVSDPILVLANPNGTDFTSTLWIIAEGPLATNGTNESQAVTSDAYIADSDTQGIFVNGAHRHDPRPGWGYEIYNGVMDAPEPGSSFFPAVTDFTTNKLAYWGSARVAFRISTKNNPGVDFTSQNFNGQFDVQYGRIVRVYSDAVTYSRKATTNPAWVLLDLMTSRRAGGGIDIGGIN